MKKLLLSIFCLFSIMSYAMADEVTVKFSEQGYENAQEVTEMVINDHLTATFSKGGNSSTTPKYYNSGNAYRLYAMNTMTITAANGVTINSIAMTTGSGDYVVNAGSTVSCGTLAINGTNATIDDINANSVTFTQGGTKGHVRIITLTVNYTTDGTVTPEPEQPGEGSDENEGEEPTEIELMDIEQIVADKTTPAKAAGWVIATYAKGFLMSDGTGDILVFLGAEHTYKVGNNVTVTGTTSEYGGLLQFGNTSVVELGESNAEITHPEPTPMSGEYMDEYLTSPSIKYVEYTGTLTISGNYYNVAVEGASKAIGSIQYPNTGLVQADWNGAVVKVTGYTIGVSSSKYVNTMTTKVEFVSEGEEKPEEPETPITGETLTVAQAIAAYVEGDTLDVNVKGFIVGTVNGSKLEEGAVFSGTAESKTNLLIADSADETDITKCIPVALPSGTIRNELNLAENSDNYKKEVILTAQLVKYFSVAGLKNTSAYQFTGNAVTPDPEQPVDPETPVDPEIPVDPETPAVSDTLTVAQALAKYIDGQKIDAVIKGYIIGTMKSNPYEPEFSSTTSVYSNIILADNADENNIENCIIVQLVNGTDIRAKLNLGDNPGNYKKEVIIAGSLESYFSQAGLKSPTAYQFTDAVAPEEPGEGEEPIEAELMDIEQIIDDEITPAKASGWVVATYAQGFLMSDGTGEILVFLGAEHTYQAGNLVTVTGATSKYGELLQFGKESVVELGEGNVEITHPEPTPMSGEYMDEYLTSPSIKYVEYTGTLTISGNYYNVAVEGATKAIGSISYPNAGLVQTNWNGAVIKVTGYTIGFTGTKYVNTMATKVEFVSEGEEKPEEPITGEILTVAQAIAAYVEGDTLDVNVKGFIVGTVNGSKLEEGAVFSGTAESKTNLLIADSADETDITKCIPVALPSGTIRNELNLAENSDNYKKEVILTAQLMKYFGVAGLKNTSAYQFTGVTAIEDIEAENDVEAIYDLTGRRVKEITKAGIYIVNGVKKVVR